VKTHSRRDICAFHSGDGAGFRAWNYRVPEASLSMIALSNVGEHDSSGLTALRKAITNAIESAASP
jgi:hypothetical protein